PIGALAAYDEGGGPRLFLGGGIHFAAPVSAANVARFDGSTWSALASGNGLEQATSEVGWVDAIVAHDAGSGPELFAAGRFAFANGQTLADVGGWDGNAWTPIAGLWPSGAFREVNALASADLGAGRNLYIAGDLLVIVNNSGSFYCFAQWNGGPQILPFPGSP